MELTARGLEAELSKLCGQPLSADEGLKFGNANAPISGIINCWSFNAEVAELARKENCNLILSHESLYVPYGIGEGTPFGGFPGDYLTWPANARRTRALVENDLQFVRFHGHADRFCVFEAFAAQLGLAEILAPGPLGYDAVYRHQPQTVSEWIERVKTATGMNTLRVASHDLSRQVTNIGLAWGGMGLFVNIFYPMKLIELGAELIIAGETDNYGFRFMQESGADVIECSHEVSENRGIAKLGDALRERLKGIKIVDFCNPCVWAGL
jgi:putative NIF3 family GTP cyclohydrolase 1 type 2